MTRPSVPGKDLTLSLNIDLQMLGERLLKNKIGSIVAIEPETRRDSFVCYLRRITTRI